MTGPSALAGGARRLSGWLYRLAGRNIALIFEPAGRMQEIAAKLAAGEAA